MADDIKYQIYNYSNPRINDLVKELYKKVFCVEMEEGLPFPFQKNPHGEPIGILAFSQSGLLVGHFATMATCAFFDGKKEQGRISFGFMVLPEYQGNGIAKQLSSQLFAFLKSEDICNYVIGFPNDNSYYMHKKYMHYKHIRDYHMCVIPEKHYDVELSFTEVTLLPENNTIQKKGVMDHSQEFLNWRYNKKEYIKYIDDNQNIYVCNKYKDSIQILYWSPDVSKADLEVFASYIREKNGTNKVRTWDVFSWMDNYPKEARSYHFAIRSVNGQRTYEDTEWTFFPGDCELF